MVGEGGAEEKGPSISDVVAVALQIQMEILKTERNFETREGIEKFWHKKTSLLFINLN